MIDDLIESIVFVGDGSVKYVDKTVGAGAQEESRKGWMLCKRCDGVGVGIYITSHG